jgi:hypothetical protein
MSRFLRAGLLALHPARRINQRFLNIGIGLVGDSPLPVGATCTLTLEMEDWQGLPQYLTLAGKIVFAGKSSWTYPFRAGLKFIRPSSCQDRNP